MGLLQNTGSVGSHLRVFPRATADRRLKHRFILTLSMYNEAVICSSSTTPLCPWSSTVSVVIHCVRGHPLCPGSSTVSVVIHCVQGHPQRDERHLTTDTVA